MTAIFATGFEYGITPVATGLGLCAAISATGGSAIAIESSTVRSGSYSLRMQGAVGGDCYMRLPGAVGSSRYFVQRLYFRIATLPVSGTADIMAVNEGGGAIICGRVYVDSSGVLRAVVGTGTAQVGPTISTGVWYRLDCLSDIGGTTWTFDWMVDGVAQTQATEGSHSADTGQQSYITAASSTSGTTDFYFDDIIQGDALADYPFGSGRVLLAPLDSAASHQSITTTQWQTTSDFSSFANFTGANETVSPPLLGPPISTATPTGFRMNLTSAIAGNGRWGMSAPAAMPNVTAQLVAAIIAVREASTGTNNATFRTELSAATTNIFSANPGWGTTWNYLASFMATGPGSVAWTRANVDAMNFEADSTDASPNIWCQGVVYEVAFPAASLQKPPALLEWLPTRVALAR